MRFFNWLNHTNMLDGCSRYLINPELGCLRYLSREELPLAWRAGSSRISRESLAALLLPHKRACSRARMKVKSRGSGWSFTDNWQTAQLFKTGNWYKQLVCFWCMHISQFYSCLRIYFDLSFWLTFPLCIPFFIASLLLILSSFFLWNFGWSSWWTQEPSP